MPTIRRLTVDNVIEMATHVAKSHLSARSDTEQPSQRLIDAIAHTWELVKGRLSHNESALLGSFIEQITGKR